VKHCCGATKGQPLLLNHKPYRGRGHEAWEPGPTGIKNFRLKILRSVDRLTVGSWQLAVGSWQLAVGSWQLAVGSWQLVVGSW
jgi:hypothetical protein